MENIITVIIGAVCIVLGIFHTKGHLSTLHSYHRKRVSEEDRIPFGKMVGTGTILVGAGLAVLGIFSLLSTLLKVNVLLIIGYVLFGICATVGFVIALCAIKKYNKGIF